MNLDKLINNIIYRGTADNRKILNITHDSRKVKKGTLFIAMPGKNNDGHDYIFDAIDKGAIAVIANGRSPVTNKVPIIQVKNPRKIMSKISANFYMEPSKKLNVIGVTGTNGKTTTTQIINHILNFNNFHSGSLGTLGFSTPSGIKSTGFTTPESIELQQILKMLLDGGIQYVPMEVSSHSIEMHRIEDVNFKIAVFTNLTPEHLDFHGTMDNYFNSKLKLFKKLKKEQYAIINNDDPYSNKIIKNIKCNYSSYGFKNNSNLQIQSYDLKLNNTQINFIYNDKKFTVQSKLIGKFNIYNIASAILCCLKLNISYQQITNAINCFYHVPGRMETFYLKNNNIAIIDYAHTPDAYEKIYSTVKEICKNKEIISVFGCGGERDKSKRPKMGKISEKFSKHIYLTNDNPRNENDDSIIKDILSGIINQNTISIIKNRSKAITECIKNHKDSVIVILGKGRENYQIVKNEKIFHSDINIIKKHLDENRNKR